MFPEEFIHRIRSQQYIDADSLLNSLKEPSPVNIRTNPGKWIKRPSNSKPVPWCTTGYYLDYRPSFTHDPLFHSGCYYPQEASGMFIDQVFKQAVNMSGYLRVLDLCGAPGGKSTHLSSLIGSGGLLVANEVIRTRASVLAENLTKWGSTNSIVTQNDPSVFSELPGFFDVILVDAPCSGEGMFRDPVALKEWSQENAFHCSERQKRILTDVWPALKENGILIYSTCTFNPAENEENVKWLSSKQMAETLSLNISDFKGITEIEYKGIKGYGFYPDRIKGEGLFISVLLKSGSTGKLIPGTRKKAGDVPKKSDLEVVRKWTVFPSENILRTGEEVFSFPGRPEDYHILSGRLNMLNKGVRICSVKKNVYIPAYELALTNSIRNDAFPISDLDYKSAIAYLRRDNFSIGDIPKGWFIATYKGTNLGFGNNIGSRVNNYFPVDWRIRMPVWEVSGKDVLNWCTK